AAASTAFNLTGSGEPLHLEADVVTADFFRTLGVAPAIGPGFGPGDDRVGGPDIVVLGHDLWSSRFNADPAVVGRAVSLNDRPYTVVGVMPEGFEFTPGVELWVPLRIDNPDYPRRAEFLTVVGRLAPDRSVEQAQAELDRVVQRLAEQYPQTNASIKGEVVSMQSDLVQAARPALLVFSAAVALVLLIACANVANLLLARASGRSREIAVRLALGASRPRLIRQILTESVVLSVIGAAVGLLLAAWALSALRVSGTTFVPRLADIGIDWAVVAFSIALGVGTGLLFGLAPAVRLVAGATLHEFLKEGSRGASAGGLRFRNALVLGEAALAIVLLCGAGLLLRSFLRLTQVEAGFDPGGVLTYEVVLPRARYAEDAQLPQLYDRLIEATRAIPGVSAVAVSSGLPLESPPYLTFELEGRSDDEGGDVQPFAVSPEHFAVLGIAVRRGRPFESADGAGAAQVALVNEEFVRRYVAGRDPLGLNVRVSGDTAMATIVGIVADVAQEGVAADPYPQVYRPIAQFPVRTLHVAFRTAGNPLALAGQARAALASVDPELPPHRLAAMDERVSGSLTRPRVSMAVLAGFAGIALALAAIGIYGVLAYSIARRTREIGIRIALGARPGDVRRLVIGQGMRPVLLGVVLGLGGALLLTRLMRSLLYGVGPTDPVTFAAVALLLTGVALVASWLPARRATRVDAVVALRAE
ncbi:MAG: ABC transporter permease, partial [Gemmatimonadota bacterium]|nr:ABC transporter permease [Gemmatimonadota bacterium]